MTKLLRKSPFSREKVAIELITTADQILSGEFLFHLIPVVLLSQEKNMGVGVSVYTRMWLILPWQPYSHVEAPSPLNWLVLHAE